MITGKRSNRSRDQLSGILSIIFKRGERGRRLQVPILQCDIVRKAFCLSQKDRSVLPKSKTTYCISSGTKVTKQALLVLSPTLDYHEGPLSRVPVMIAAEKKTRVDEIVGENIALSRCDWDSDETSWEFKKHPLI